MAGVALLLLALAFHTHAQSAITREAIAGGGGVSTGGVYAIDTTIGQADATRRRVSGGYALAGGFRAAAKSLDPARIPQGMVAWWRGEENTLDTLGAHHGFLSNGVTYVPGHVGMGFNSTGAFHQKVRVLAAPPLDVGLGDGLTIEGWVRPNNFSQQTIAEWITGTSGSPGGVQFYLNVAASGGPGSLYANLFDVNSVSHVLFSPGNLLSTNVFQHVGLTYDRSSGMARLFLNGVAVTNVVVGDFTPRTLRDFNLGGGRTNSLNGQLDELSLYNRALTTNELAAIHAAGAAGKSTLHPYFLTGPELPVALSEVGYTQHLATVLGVAPVTLAVSAGRLPAGLMLSSVGTISGVPTEGGTFTFAVAATDAVSLSTTQWFTLPAQNRISPPPGIVSWWRAESNSLDFIGSNHGTNLNGTTFTNAVIGSAFHFDGVNDRVSIPDHPSLRPTSLTVEGWVRYNATNGLRAIAGKTVGSGDANSFTFYSFNGVLRGGVGNASGPSSVFAIDTLALTTGRWYHVAFTFDEATAMQSLYVDGTNTVSVMADRPTGYDTNAINLGLELNSGAYVWAFSGALDEFSFYNRALAPEEIAALRARDLRGKAFSGPYFTTVPELPYARIGRSYSQQLVTTRATPPVTNEVVSGVLPPGLSLSEAGWITGVPTNVGAFTFTVRATDSNGLAGEQPFSLTVLPADPRPTNLVAWWRAEDNALDAVGTNHGTLLNGATYFGGRVGRAFRFDGTNDYMRVADAPALRPASLTVEGWVRYYRTDGTRTFINKPVGAGSTTNRSFTVYSHDGVLRGFVGNAGGNSTVIASNHFALTSNRWYHLAFTYDGTTGLQTLYVDGAFATNAVANQPIGYDTNTVTMGMQYYAGFNTWYFSGIQDEVAFYNRALTATEIASIYNAGAAGKNVPPIANADTFTNVATLLLKIPKAGILANDTDADGDTLTFSSLPLTTTNGVTMITNSTFLFYTNGASVADQFSYVISDGFGGSATGTVSIVVLTNVTGQITGQLTVSNNVATAYFAGRPGWTYTVQRSTNLLNWTNIWTTNTPASGLFQFTDDFNDLGAPPPAAYYRLRWP
jgi:Concanavalin A-like lectin/glucanases superfamily/Putative Ig domain/Bacterial Ig domain